jgi:hypothetical protein
VDAMTPASHPFLPVMPLRAAGLPRVTRSSKRHPLIGFRAGERTRGKQSSGCVQMSTLRVVIQSVTAPQNVTRARLSADPTCLELQ